MHDAYKSHNKPLSIRGLQRDFTDGEVNCNYIENPDQTGNICCISPLFQLGMALIFRLDI